VAWRTVVIANPAKLSVKNSQLIIAQDEEIPLPLDDICTLVLESPQISLTSALLYRIAQAGIHLVVCDEKHMPCLSGLAFDSHSRLFGTQRIQIDSTLPFKKRCWQQVIRQKIANQAACLDLAGKTGGDQLRALLPKIKSGDSSNVEANAARRYFTYLFGGDFIRGMDDTTNICLDYGYAIFRAVVARSLSAHGFLLGQGIHHRNELNSFNLADDFIEPFRPIVDLFVADSVEPESDFTAQYRQDLASLAASEVRIDDKFHSATYAAEIMAASFLAACKAGSAALLKLPSQIEPRTHQYE
jgi:CRISPR-associated protein Cas1